MNKWYDNILFHPKTHKPLLPYNGDYPMDKIRECLSECLAMETEYIQCYCCWNLADKHYDVCAISKLEPQKRIRLGLFRKPKFKMKDDIICIQDTLSKNWYKVLPTKDGSPLIIAAGTNNWYHM